MIARFLEGSAILVEAARICIDQFISSLGSLQSGQPDMSTSEQAQAAQRLGIGGPHEALCNLFIALLSVAGALHELEERS